MAVTQSVMGSIPACAGEAYLALLLAMMVPVYPRVCGGSCRCRGYAGRSRGLSPRVRGKRVAAAALPSFPRSIPACAGEAIS